MFINFLEKYQCLLSSVYRFPSKIKDFSSKSGENQSSALVDLPVLKGHDAKGMEQLCQDTVFVHPVSLAELRLPRNLMVDVPCKTG